jgi:oligopeptide transport system substrate-binding protein
MRRLLSAILAGVLLAGAIGCSGTKNQPTPTDTSKPTTPAPAKEQVVRINIGTNPETLDPGKSTGIPEANVEGALFEGLLRLDENGKPVPGLAAEMPTVSPDGLTYTFKLRDAQWSNGDPITTEDFIWSWQRVLNPFTAAEYATFLYPVKGAQEMNSVPMKTKGADGKEVDRPEADVKADIAKAEAGLQVKAVDAKTLQVTLVAPLPYFDFLAYFHTLRPVHRKTVEADPEGWFRKADFPVTGPFKLQSWVPKDKVIVVKNPAYYDAAKVKLDKIEYYLIDQESTATTMFESGQLDFVESGVSRTEMDRLKKERPNELKILPYNGVYYYMFNVTKAPLDNIKVRKALTLAIDRKAIVENITKGGEVPAMSVVPAGVNDVTGDFRKNGGDFFKDNDVAEAKKLLAEAGFPDGKGFPKLEILYNTLEMHKKIAEAIQEMWKQNLGIEVTMTNAEWAVYMDRRDQLDFTIARAGWIGDYPDPMTFLDMWEKAGNNNDTGWEIKAFADLIAKVRATGDQKVRMQAMHDAEKIIMDEMPIMPIYHYTSPYLINPKLQGWKHYSTGSVDLRDAFWQQ